MDGRLSELERGFCDRRISGRELLRRAAVGELWGELVIGNDAGVAELHLTQAANGVWRLG